MAQSSSFGEFSSLAEDFNTISFGPSATPIFFSNQSAYNSFITVLGLAQKLRIPFMNITWQTGLGRLGKGGQSVVNQALVNVQTRFAFKCFNHPDNDPLRETIQELMMLSHPVIRAHQHIVTLEGICWDIPKDDEVWPVLVFQKSHYDNLHKLASLVDLSLKDRIRLCASIGVALRDMHCNGIVHGDLKPQNVLLFEQNDRITAKVADFGFATYFQGENDLMSLPKSVPWNAPEHHGGHFKPEQAKRMDVFSFGLLCFWLLFFPRSTDNLPLPPKVVLENDRFVSFNPHQPEKNMLQIWKKERMLLEWICWLLHNDERFDSSIGDNLVTFFQSTLAPEPSSRLLDIQRLLSLLVPDLFLAEEENIRIDWNPELVNFEVTIPQGILFNADDKQIAPSIWDFYDTDFRLSEYIVYCLKSNLVKSSVRSTSASDAALQLALCYYLGFGTPRDDQQAMRILSDHGLEQTQLEEQIQLIKKSVQIPFNRGDLSQELTRQGHIQYIDFPQYYRMKKLLERAEISQKQSLQNMELILGRSHELSMMLKSRLANIMTDQGQLNQAEELNKQVVDTSLEVFGMDHPSTFNSLANLASTYFRQGRWKMAEELQVQLLGAVETLGVGHPIHLMNMANLAATYCSQGRWQEAENLELQVIQTRNEIFGAEHPDTLGSVVNLASSLCSQHRWAEAEKLLKSEMTEKGQRTLGVEHPIMLHILSMLASTYTGQGRWKDAENLQERLVKMSQETLGTQHLRTLAFMSHLAATYHNQGKLEEAEELQTRIIETSEKALGAKHPDTLNRKTNLATTYRHQGRFEEAENLQEQVIEISKVVQGIEHPSTLDGMGNLALIYRDQGRWNDAETLQIQHIELSKKVHGAEHQLVLNGMDGLALIYRDQGRYQEAESLGKEVVTAMEESLGLEHPITLSSIDNLALTYCSQGRFAEAETLQMRCNELCKKVLGADHPNTLANTSNLASTYREQERYSEAEELQKQELEISKRILGAEHPDTVTSMHNLAITYHCQEQLQEAEDLGIQVLYLRLKIFGVNHPETLRSMSNLALVYRDQKRWHKAEQLDSEVLEASIKILGPEHPDTLTSMSNLACLFEAQGLKEDSISLMEECCQLQKRILGPDHPDSKTSQQILNRWKVKANESSSLSIQETKIL